jgi:two-component system, sensor histidine kinase and response regulator
MKMIESQMNEIDFNLELISSVTHDAVIMIDDNGYVLFLNNAAELMFGYAKDEIIGHHVHSLLAPQKYHQDAILGMDCFAQTGQGPILKQIRKFQAIDKSAKEFPIELSVSSLKIKNRWHAIAIIRDISEQQKTQQQLLKNERRLRELIINVADGILVLNEDSVIQFINPAAATLFGRTVKEMQDQLFGYPVTTNESTELNIVRADAVPMVVEMRIAATQWEEKPGYVVSLRDITERKQMLEELDLHRHHLEAIVAQRTAALQEAEDKYRTVADFTYDWETWIDTQGKWLYCSPGCERVSGYRAEQFIDRPKLFLDIILAEDQAIVTDHLREGHAGHRAHELCFRIRRKDGEIRWIEHICQPISDETGMVVSRRASNRDITERKLHEQQLIEARNTAEAASQSKGTFLANMSHEIRTPMNAIIGLTHLMKRGRTTLKQQEQLEKIDSAAVHLLSIISDILDMSKIEAGKLNLEQTDFHLDSVFDQIKSLLKEQIDTKNLSLEIDNDSVPLWLKGDVTRLRQALLNYVGNAIKFTEQGTITIRAKIIAQQNNEVLVRFEVQDTGIGIDADKLAHIFEAFEQADESTTRKYGGTGLGLVITRRLAQIMRGNAGAESQPGQGSTFWFTAWLGIGHGILPSKNLSDKVDTEAELRVSYTGSRILLVEDNIINREVALELLSSTQLAVDTAENGREAVNKVRDISYDLVLMDVQMPEMDGLEATRLIRAMPTKAGLPILAMTANIFAEDLQACKTAGMNDFISKPVNPENLFTTIIKWLPKQVIADNPSSLIVEPSNFDKNNHSKLRVQLAAIEWMDSIIGLRNVNDDVAVYLRLLKQFDNNHGDDTKKITRYLANGNIGKAQKLVHALKGVSGTLGLSYLQQAAITVEEELRHSVDNKNNTLIQQLIKAINSEQYKLHQFLSQISEHAESECLIKNNPIEVQKTLNSLEELLEIDDTSVNDLFVDSEPLLRLNFDTKTDQLGQQINSFDYKAALLTVKSMLVTLAKS